MKRTLIIWIIYFAGLLLAFGLSSCSSTVINGVRIPEKSTSTKIDPETHFYMTVSFWLAFGITAHFYGKKNP